MRIVLTHPEPRVAPLALALSSRGHAVLELPLRRLVSLADDPAVSARLASASSFDWVVFVSPGAVDAAVPSMQASACGLPRRGIAVIGPGTEAALRAHGLRPTPSCPWVRPSEPPFDAAALMREPAFDIGAGATLLIVRGQTGREDWIEELRGRRARVELVAVLRSEPVDPPAEPIARARRWLGEAGSAPLGFVFTTVDAIERLSAMLPDGGRDTALAWAVHPRQVARLRAEGWMRAELLAPGQAGLIAAIESAIEAQPARTDPR